MKILHLSSISIFLILMLLIFSCQKIPDNVQQVLDLSGHNRKELEAVLDHYKEPKNNLKLKAAYFLIGNMIGRNYNPNNEFVNVFVEKMDSLNRIDSVVIEDKIPELWKELARTHGGSRGERIWDIQSVTSNQLIENIDEAFKVWEKVPWSEQYDFSEFCRFVLPYRSKHEVPMEWRKTIQEDYKWMLDSADLGIVTLSNMLTDSLLWFKYYGDELAGLPEMKVKDLYKIKYGTCNQLSTLKVAALRSVGIPCAQVFDVPPVTGWVSVLDESKNQVDYGDFYKLEVGKYYLEESNRRFTKVYMSTFEIQPYQFDDEPLENVPPFFRNRYIRDVSGQHGTVTKVKLDITYPSTKNSKFIFLHVFQRGEFIAADWAKVEDGKVAFDQIAHDRFYFPFYYEDGQLMPAADAFYVNETGQQIPMGKKLDKGTQGVKMSRKYPRTPPEKVFAGLMVGATIEGSNDPNFNDATLLHTIDTEPTKMEEENVLSDQNKFRYLRYKSNKLIGISDVAFLDDTGNLLEGQPILSANMDIEQVKNAFDNDIRTNCNSIYIKEIHSKMEIVDQVFDDYWFGLDLGKPKQVSKVRYLFRNSFNTIEPGHEYELVYWDSEWKSIGKKKAEGFEIYFDNVPKQTILWLKDLETGVWEEVFFIKDGIQVFA